jgi:Zn-dependent alcohol dehydrogenase
MTTSRSEMTTAVVASGFGGPEVLSVVELPIGLPGPGEVLIHVRAAGTNPIDYKSDSGAFSRDSSQLPLRLGREARAPAGPAVTCRRRTLAEAESTWAFGHTITD